MSTRQGLPVLKLPDRAAWELWLQEHHADSPGVWLQLAKRGSPTPTVTQAEAIEQAVCFGWIDGQIGRLDEHFYLQRFTPRRPGSRWSAINRERAERLISEGRMKPAGRREYEAALADGRLAAAYEPQSRITVPPDLQAALDQNPGAAEFFGSLRSAERYAFLYRLHHVGDPARRARRIADYIERLNAGRTLRDS